MWTWVSHFPPAGVRDFLLEGRPGDGVSEIVSQDPPSMTFTEPVNQLLQEEFPTTINVRHRGRVGQPDGLFIYTQPKIDKEIQSKRRQSEVCF